MKLSNQPIAELVFALGMHGSMVFGDIKRLLGDKAQGTMYAAFRAGIITLRSSGHVSLNPTTCNFNLEFYTYANRADVTA